MSLPITRLQISPEEHRQRCDKLVDYLEQQNLTGMVLFDRSYVLYYTGFAFIPTERPIGFAISRGGERAMFVPRLEVEHAQMNALIDRVDHYIEYPHDPHPMTVLARMLAEMGISGAGARIGADNDGYPWVFGYRGPTLTELTGAAVVPVRAFIEDQMMIKSAAEVNCIRESCRWSNLAHMLLQRYTVVGATETEVSQRASDEATRAMLDGIGPLYRSQDEFSYGVFAGYRGQIGRNAAIPHALANNITFQPGDVLVTGAAGAVWGYNSELERTMIMGKPSDEFRRFFDHMLTLQETAFEAIRPGALCADVDAAVRGYYERNSLMDYWKHHVGHGLGMRYHEAPFLDIGDKTVIQPGMILTVEPGLYVPGLGGFRHSDTVLVTDDGIEILTYYPRDLDSLTLPA